MPYMGTQRSLLVRKKIAPASTPAVFSITSMTTKLDTGGGTTVSYGTPAIGTADVNRVVVIALWVRAAAPTVNSVSIAGTTAIQVSSAAATVAGTSGGDIWYVNLSSGTTASVSVTYNGSTLESAIQVYSVITNTVTPSVGTGIASASSTALARPIAIPSGGGMIGVFGVTVTAGGATVTWSGGTITEDADTDIGARHFSAAHDTADAGTAPTITATYTGGGAPTAETLSIAAWGP